jgi:hypothetical protein
MEVARVTVRGRDATVRKAGVDGRRCAVRAMTAVGVQTGANYEVITADGERRYIGWPQERLERCLPWGDCFYYPDTVGVHFYVNGEGEAGKVWALYRRGYVRVNDIARMWNIPGDRVMQIVQRDDFPPPAQVVGTKNLWSIEDLGAWWCRDGRHVPGSCEVQP